MCCTFEGRCHCDSQNSSTPSLVLSIMCISDLILFFLLWVTHFSFRWRVCLHSYHHPSLSVSLSCCASLSSSSTSHSDTGKSTFQEKKRPHLSRVEDVYVLKLYNMTGVVKNPGSLPFLHFLPLHYDYIVISSSLVSSPSKMVGIRTYVLCERYLECCV